MARSSEFVSCAEINLIETAYFGHPINTDWLKLQFPVSALFSKGHSWKSSEFHYQNKSHVRCDSKVAKPHSFEDVI